jgi:hypothetical protein
MNALPLLATTGLLIATIVATFAQCGGQAVAALPSGQDPRAAAAPQPADSVRLLVSGSMQGRLEPCGCAGGQLGGLARRMQHIGEQRNYDILIEGGDLVDGATELDVLKLYTATSILFQMQHPYDVLGVGQKDLLVPRAEWSAFAGAVPVVASDLASTAPDWPARPFVEKEVRGQKVRIASLTLSLPAADETLRLLPPAEAWAAALKDAPASTLRVVMLHCTDTAARALVPKLQPPPDLAVCMDPGYIEPSPNASLVEGVPLLFAGIRGRMLIDVRLSRQEGRARVSCELVPLAGSKTVPGGGGDPNVKEALLEHRHEVKRKDVLAHMMRQVPTQNGASYVGSSICKGCHPSASAAWQKSKHHAAWDTLVKAEADAKRYGWPVTAYPDCVSCHVVGFREQSGFVSFAETPDLAAVGCERCHGPASAHIANPAQNRLGILGGVLSSVLCTQCHDFEQSPDFQYLDKWKLIEHGCEPGQKTQETQKK